MKTKNLLLAGLAVFAMTACNNEIEGVDNNDLPLEKNASMKLDFTFPKSSTTRAVDAGSDFEYGVSKVTAILEYTETNKRLVVDNLPVLNGPNGDKVVTATTGQFQVSAGTISKISVIINNDDTSRPITVTTDLNDLTVSAVPYTLPTEGLDYLRGTIAKNDNFLMSGISTTPITIESGKTETAVIKVSRVSAKLEESTDENKGFEFTSKTAVKSKDGKKISIRIIGHSYTNLNANSYVFANNAGSWSGSALQAYSTTNASDFYRWRTSETTYCLENITGAAKADWDRATATSALYKGQVYLGNDKLTGKFYVKAKFDSNNNVVNTLYSSWSELLKDFTILNNGVAVTNEDDLTAEILKANSLMQYNGGVCYYDAPIMTDGATVDIVRNNWYKLSVNTIADLGTPTPTPEDKPKEAYLILSVEVQPWTIQGNSFDLE